MSDQIYKQLKEVANTAKQGVALSKHTTFKIGGPAKYFVKVVTIEELQLVLQIVNEQSLNHLILGGGSNLLVGDGGFEGVVIQLGFETIKIDGDHVYAEAGAKTAVVAQKAIEKCLTNFEWGASIPGTIGGAVRGNAGCIGGEMKDVVESVEALVDGEITRLSNQECGFNYRTSFFKKSGGIILAITLNLEKTDAQTCAEKVKKTLEHRIKTQPKGFASSGCVFKNLDLTIEMIEKLKDKNIPQEFFEKKRIPAGWLIEKVGLKGEKQGKAKVSDVHANFILTEKGAKAEDILTLIETIKQKVYSEYEVDLIEEIKII